MAKTSTRYCSPGQPSKLKGISTFPASPRLAGHAGKVGLVAL